MNGKQGEPGKPGQPGEPGKRGGGRGGAGGAGGRGGAADDHSTWRHRNPALYGYLIASLVFTALLYALLFQIRHDNLEQCQRNNYFRAEVNKRSIPINTLIARENQIYPQRPHGTLAYVATVPLVDCEERFSKPWPF